LDRRLGEPGHGDPMNDRTVCVALPVKSGAL
jgi:hypothetical protein